MSDLLPLLTCASIAQFSTTDEGFALHVVSTEDERTFRGHVDFAVAFAGPPLVHVGLAGFDIDHGDSARLRAHAEAVTATGFDVVLTTWLGTKVYGAAVSWLAIGQPVG
jgi:hypothetical protein